MASTQQGARDFIQNNWDKAVAGLNHVHLLLPGLRTTRVLDENEISDIDSCNERFEKNRKVLSMIVKKGNAACEVFLNLLDTKRKWSLDGGAHHWIDCFNFDGSGPYRAQLKLAARRIVDSKWKNSRKLLAKYVKELQFKYTPLVLVNDVSDVYPENKYKKSRKKKCKRYIPKEDKPINIEDLLTMKEKKILLVGKPGIGKTFCVLQLLNLWAESIEDTLYVFYFDAGSARHVRDSEDLRSLLFSYCKPERKIEDDLYTDIISGNTNVLLIFDSFDEIRPTCQNEKIERVIYGILNKYELEKAKVIVTCRPSEEERELPDWADCRVEVRGFGEKSISEYFKTTLEGQCICEEDVMLYEKNINVFSLCHVPQYAFIVMCYMLSEGRMKLQQKISSVTTPSTVTELYVHIFRHCVGQHMLKVTHSGTGNVDVYIEQNKEEIMTLAKKGFDAILIKSVNLTDCQLKIMPCQSIKCCFLGSTSIDDTLTSKETYFAFLHNTMQEFFAALWISENKSNIRNIFQRSLTEGESHLKYVVYFLCGLLTIKNSKLMARLFQENPPDVLSESVIHNIIELIQSAEEDIGGEERILFACQCLYEAQSTKACAQVLEAIDFEFCLEDEHIDPYQSRAVTYVVNEAIKETYSDLEMQDLRLFSLGYKLLLESTESYRAWGKKKSNCCQCVLESEDQKNFLEMMEFEVYVSLHWYSETLRTLGRLMKQSVEKVDIILDSVFSRDSHESFICFVSECLEKMASVRFSGGWNDFTFWSLCRLFQQYEAEKGDSSLLHLISLFAPFPNDVISADLDWIDRINFRFIRQCLQNEIVTPQYKEALRGLEQLIILSLEMAVRKGFLSSACCYKYVMDCGNQWNFNEYLRLRNNEVHVNPIWSEETLKRMSDFIKHSSKRVNMILACDGYCEIRERCVHFLSDCLGWTSSICFSIGFNEKSFITMMELCQMYDGITGGYNLYKFVELFGPLTNKVDFKDTSWISQVDFRFLQKYLNKDGTQWHTYSDSLSALDQFIIRTLFNISRHDRTCYSDICQYIQQSRNVKLSDKKVFVSWRWNKETLNSVKDFVECSSTQVDMMVDSIDYGKHDFIIHVSDCLDKISSIRFLDGFNKFTFWRMCDLFKEYKKVKGDHSLPHLISLFAPFPNMVPSSDTGYCSDFFDFTFLSQCQQDKVTVPEHREAFQGLRRCVLSSILEAIRMGQRRFTWCYKCMVDCGDLNDFNESLRLTNNEVHVNPNWTEETLKTMSCFIKSSSSKADISLDNIGDYYNIKGRFVYFLSDCLDWISSIRLIDGFDEFSFWWICHLLCEYKKVKGDHSLPHLISLLAPFPNMVPSSGTGYCSGFFDFTFLSQCQEDKVAVPEHREALQDLRRCVLSSILEAIRVGQRRYTWYYKCMVDCGDLNVFNESLRLTNNEVHIDPNWTEETLKTMSCLLKSSSSKADIRLDNIYHYHGINEGFVHFLSDCLDWISSIRCHEDVLLTCSKGLYTGGQRLAKLFLKKLGHKIEIKWSPLKNSSCKHLGKLMSHCRRDLSLTLTPEAIALRGLQLLCKSWRHLQTLRINEVTTRLISKLIRTKRKDTSVSVKEMVILRSRQRSIIQRPHLISWSTIQRPHLISYLSIILRHWNVNQLDLSECDLDGHFVTNLLSLQDHISLRLSKKTLQDLVFIIYEAQDVLLVKSFLNKVGYDLSSCKLNWNVLHFLLSHSDKRIKTDLRRCDLQEHNLVELLPWLHRVHPSGMNERLSKMLLKVIFDSGSVELIDLWLQLSDHRVNFNKTELGLSHCDALRLVTERSCRVRLSLLWTSFTDETAEKLLSMMGRVSELSLDRSTLLKFLRKLTEVNDPEAVQNFFKALRCTLDFSSSSEMDISSDDTSQLHQLSFNDCQVISKSVGLLKDKTELNINNCEIEEGGLEVLFDIFDKVHLRTSKELLLRFISMTDENNTKRIISLGRAIGSTVDLSGTHLSADTCRSLAIVINYTEEDCEVDLSKCSLSTECIEQLSACLHKIRDLDVSNNNLNDEATQILASTLSQGDSLHVIDLSSNNITDAGAAKIHDALNGKANLEVVRLYNNQISNRAIFGKDPRYEIW